MLEAIFILLIILAIVLVVFGRPKTFVPPKTTPSDQRTYKHFNIAQSLFVNRAELMFFHELHRILPEEFFLMSKVRLEDVIGVKSNVKDPEARWKLRARVKSRHVDFLIIDKTGLPRMVVELDGASHDSESFNADTLKNGLFRTTGMKFVRVPVGCDYAAQCRNIIDALKT